MTPFKRAPIPQSEIDRTVAATTREYNENPEKYKKTWGFPPEATLEDVLVPVKDIANDEVYLNDLYQVNVRRYSGEKNGFPPLVHLSIKRRDKEAVHDWRHFQQIKNDLVGPECEGIELYPAETRVVDTANQYHIWVIDDKNYRFPFGWQTGVKVGHSSSGAIQRPF